MQQKTGKEYFATKPIEEIADAIVDKFRAYQQWMHSTGYLNRIETAFNCYYGFDAEGSLRISSDNRRGAKVNVNHYQSLVRRLHLIVTEAKLAFQPRSHNSDAKNQIKSDLARAILEAYSDDKNMHGVLSSAVLGALIQLEQYVWCPWSIQEGAELTTDGDNIIRTGDQHFQVISPLDCARNTSAADSKWYIVRVKGNKHDLAAQYPEFADEILSETLEVDLKPQRGAYRDLSMRSEDDDDHVYRYFFYHARTPALPLGRRVEVVAGQVLLDDELTYDKVPVFRISAGDILHTTFGDSPAVPLLPLQEALSALFSATVSNNLNNALQLIYCQDKNITVGPAINGQKIVTATSEPKALNLTASASENYKMIDMLVQHQQLLSGVNDVARGAPGASVKTAGGQSLMLAQAIQYVSELQKQWARLASDVASCLISNIQRFATDEMTAYIVGASKRGQVRKFKSQDLIDIDRVSVDLGNPLTQTYAGRSDLIAQWSQAGIIKNPQQVVQFLATGNLDQNIEDEFSDAILIRDENEMLRQGVVPPVFILDRHVEHIMKHKELASSPEARANPALMEAVTAHLQEHIAAMRNMPQDLAAVLSGQPLPPPPEAGPMPPPEQPSVDGQPLPNVPSDAPPQVQANFQQRLSAVPPDNSGEF